MKKITIIMLSIVVIIATMPLLVNATVSPSGQIYGDLYLDGDVNTKDIWALQQYISGNSVSIDMYAADVFYDGNVDSKDLLQLKKYICGYSVVLGPTSGTTVTATTSAISQTTTTDDEQMSVEDIVANIQSADYSDTKVDTKITVDDATYVALSDDGVKVTGDGVTVTGNVIELTEEGSYVFSGTMSDGQIYTQVDANVYIILNGVNLTCKTSSPIAIFGSKKKVITVQDGTTNTLTDASTYTTFYNTDGDEPNATVFAKNSLTVNGTGTLTINSNYNNGIASKDILKVLDAKLNVTTTVGNAIKGNAGVILKNTNITVNSASDGIKSDSETVGEGYIICYNSSVNITSIEDGYQSFSYLYFVGGNYNVKTGSNGSSSSYSSSDDTSRKGIKCDNNLLVANGDSNLNMTFNCADDAIHCNDSVIIQSGTFTISTSDDAVHADNTLQIDNGTVNVTKCYEGYEGATIIINGGSSSITSSDDGINASDGSSTTSQMGGFNQQQPSTSSNVSLQINGGYLYNYTSGDGVDSNNTISFNGGKVVVVGPFNGGNTCLDSQNGMTYTGGTILGISSSSAMWSSDVVGKITGNYIYNTSAGSISSNGMVCVLDSNSNLLTAVKISVSGSIGIVYMTDLTTSLTSCKFNLNGTFTGTLDSNGAAFSGSISGGTNVSSGSTSGSGNITTTRRRGW